MRSVRIGPVAAETLADSCAAAYPLEGCGLLIGRTDGQEVVVTRSLRCLNVAPTEERTHRFSIDPRVVINVSRSLRDRPESLVGFFHSHPDAAAVPSATDLEFIRLWPDVVWLIVPVELGTVAEGRAWWLDAGGAETPRELEVVRSAPQPLAAACPE